MQVEVSFADGCAEDAELGETMRRDALELVVDFTV